MTRYNSIKKYETIFIAKPDLSDGEVEKLSDEFKEVVNQNEAEVRVEENWGKRKLAYPVKKYREGYYVLFYVEGLPSAIAELERRFRIDERILRFITVKIKEHDQWTPSPFALQKKTIRPRIEPKAEPRPQPQPEPRPTPDGGEKIRGTGAEESTS
jgi:small subunit ribosomal protein S6